MSHVHHKRQAQRCTADDCDEGTSDKPYCYRHVHLMPYVAELPHMRLARGERVEVSKADREAVREAAKAVKGASGRRVRCPCGALFQRRGARHTFCEECVRMKGSGVERRREVRAGEEGVTS